MQWPNVLLYPKSIGLIQNLTCVEKNGIKNRHTGPNTLQNAGPKLNFQLLKFFFSEEDNEKYMFAKHALGKLL